MENKSTLKYYRGFKRNIKEERWIDNTEESKILVRARTNTLDLNWRNSYRGKSEQFPTCDCVTQTLQHFIIQC